MTAIGISVPRSPARPRLLITAGTLACVIVTALSGVALAQHNQLVDINAVLVSTQSDLSATQATLGSTQSELAATQATLSLTQNELSETKTARDAFQTKADGLSASVAQLTTERDGVKADLEKARANVDQLTTDLQRARNATDTANAERDTARSNLELLGQASLLLADVVKAYDEYDDVVSMQLRDLLASSNAAVAYNWTSQRYYIGLYNNRLSLQNQKTAAVQQALQKLSNFIRNHPTNPSTNASTI